MFLYNKINELLSSNKKSKNDLAEGIGVSESSVKKWAGGLSVPAADKVESMSIFFDVSIYLFFDRIKENRGDINKSQSVYGNGHNIQNGHNGHVSITQMNNEKEIEHLKSLLIEKDKRLKDKDQLIELLSKNR